MIELSQLGWNARLEEQFRPHADQALVPARVSREHRGLYVVYAEAGELLVSMSGKLRNTVASTGQRPAVGDWVAIRPRPDEDRATIHAVLPRHSSFSRKVAGGRTEEQVVAANVDTVFLVSGLDGDYNLRRIERYLGLAWQSGAVPVLVLNKADVCENVETVVGEVESIAIGVPIHVVSATQNSGVDDLRRYVGIGKTAALLGSSGVGKSTLINRLIGSERQRVQPVREDDSHGRHTTSYRELIPLPHAGCIIDTPGMRELQMWGDSDGVSAAFEDIETLAEACKFRDCSHEREPGCAVRRAIDSGQLDAKRLSSYHKLQRELRYLDRRQDQRAQQVEREKWKRIAVWHRKHTKAKRKP